MLVMGRGNGRGRKSGSLKGKRGLQVAGRLKVSLIGAIIARGASSQGSVKYKRGVRVIKGDFNEKQINTRRLHRLSF